jgi:hypothetical protein
VYAQTDKKTIHASELWGFLLQEILTGSHIAPTLLAAVAAYFPLYARTLLGFASQAASSQYFWCLREGKKNALFFQKEDTLLWNFNAFNSWAFQAARTTHFTRPSDDPPRPRTWTYRQPMAANEP